MHVSASFIQHVYNKFMISVVIFFDDLVDGNLNIVDNETTT